MKKIPKLGFMRLSRSSVIDPLLKKAVQKMIRREVRYGDKAYGPPHIVDLYFLDKPPTRRAYDIDRIKDKRLVEIFNFSKELFPAEMEYWELNEYWSVAEILKQSRALTTDEFKNVFETRFLENEHYKKNKTALAARKQTMEDIFSKTLSPLFGTEKDARVSMYITTDENNENTEYAPYVFVGKSMVVVALRRWIL